MELWEIKCKISPCIPGPHIAEAAARPTRAHHRCVEAGLKLPPN